MTSRFIRIDFESIGHDTGPVLTSVITSHPELRHNPHYARRREGANSSHVTHFRFKYGEGMRQAMLLLLTRILRDIRDPDRDAAIPSIPMNPKTVMNARKNPDGWFASLLGTAKRPTKHRALARSLFVQTNATCIVDFTEFPAHTIHFYLDDVIVESFDDLIELRRAIANDTAYSRNRIVRAGGRDLWENPLYAQRECMRQPPVARLEGLLGRSRKDRSDTKFVIATPSLSEHILSRAEPPSLVEMLLNSVAVITRNDAEKDVPQLPEFEYNHFVTIASLLAVRPPGEKRKRWLCYDRAPSVRDGSNVHTQGRAMIWGCHGAFRLTAYPSLPFDLWLLEVANYYQGIDTDLEVATKSLVRHMIQPTLRIENCAISVAPLGVITRDQRGSHLKRPDAECRRVYTTYVFEVVIDMPREDSQPLSQFVEDLALNSKELSVLLDDVDPDDTFCDDYGNINVMDKLAWLALQPNAPASASEGSAWYHIGFETAPDSLK